MGVRTDQIVTTILVETSYENRPLKGTSGSAYVELITGNSRDEDLKLSKLQYILASVKIAFQYSDSEMFKKM